MYFGVRKVVVFGFFSRVHFPSFSAQGLSLTKKKEMNMNEIKLAFDRSSSLKKLI